MLLRTTVLAILLVALVTVPTPAGLDPTASRPPVAKKVPHSQSLHGETLRDDYFWLRDKKNPDVIAYLEAENAYTDAVMKPTIKLQETLYQEMLGRMVQTDLSVPTRQ